MVISSRLSACGAIHTGVCHHSFSWLSSMCTRPRLTSRCTGFVHSSIARWCLLGRSIRREQGAHIVQSTNVIRSSTRSGPQKGCRIRRDKLKNVKSLQASRLLYQRRHLTLRYRHKRKPAPPSSLYCYELQIET